MIQRDTATPYPYVPMASSLSNPFNATYQEQINALSQKTNQCVEVYTQQSDGLLGAAPFSDIDDRKWVTTCLSQMNHQTVTGQILTISKEKLKGLGFFKLPDESQLPIKFDFPLATNHLDFLDINGIKSCSVKGKLRMDMENVNRYIYNHPIGSFRDLRSQNKPAWSIPVVMEPTALVHRNGFMIPTPNIQQIIQHLKSLKDNTVTANIVFFQINSRGGIASYNIDGFETRFLFRLPQELQHTPQDQLYQQFDRLKAKIHFSMDDTQLTDYVCSLGAEAFTHAKGSRYKLQIFAREEKLIERNDRQV
ncbi:hypothetical protein GV64_13790 [Endozoicomonas elysicola]|uniref:Uncharacterized protein n=2 Tax=Endozoicomonas elysicola TaxID=305900 RepID=A0A081KBZ1_9GAMM|nr:hypothetical protein GV64_13790 [Endozoicomonas elysicola]